MNNIDGNGSYDEILNDIKEGEINIIDGLGELKSILVEWYEEDKVESYLNYINKIKTVID